MKQATYLVRTAQALLVDYASVYYVDAVNHTYHCYSEDACYSALGLPLTGEDFFRDLPAEVERVVCPEDRETVLRDLQEDRMLAATAQGSRLHLTYRLMIDGQAVYHSVQVIHRAVEPGKHDYFVLGVQNIDREVRRRQESERIQHERETYNQIARSLAGDYESIYYVDLETGAYSEFSSNERYREMHVTEHREDFFRNAAADIKKYIHPDDQAFALSLYHKESMLKKLAKKPSFSYKYRFLINGESRYYRFTMLRANDGRHLLLCLKDINDEITAETQQKAEKQIQVTYGQIAESLAANYDVIYYIDIDNGRYAGFTTNAIYGQLEIQEEGNDFFTESVRNSQLLVHPEDRDRVVAALDRDHMLTALDNRKQFTTDYRLIVDGKPQYTRLTVMRSSDKLHFIIGVENINEEVHREREHLKALNTEKELARRDELTGTKNKTAYLELERSVQTNLDNGVDYLPFAILVCDINELKLINDTEGHHAGDEYIKACSKLLCDTFVHSPVFRVGGDEFVVFLRGDDYPVREKLLAKVRRQSRKNLTLPDAPVVAVGLAHFEAGKDTAMSQVFERADAQMYEDKRRLKQLQDRPE